MGAGTLRYLFEDCALDTDRRELRRGSDLVPVEPQVFDLLVYVISNRERVVSRDDLLASIWHGRIVSESALNTRISAARFAIGDNGEDQRLIKTLPRKGVRFVGAVREDQRPAEPVARQPFMATQHAGNAAYVVSALQESPDGPPTKPPERLQTVSRDHSIWHILPAFQPDKRTWGAVAVVLVCIGWGTAYLIWRAPPPGEGANVINAVIKPSPTVAAGQRVALLIGNTNYKLEAPLKNPKNDVVAIQRELRKLGFSTTTLYDGTSEQIADYVRLFQSEANGADWALFYFAGRGIEVDGINYMVPINADGDLPTFTRDHPNMRLETAFESVRGAKLVRLVVADSCRVDPANPPDAFDRGEPSRVFKVIEPPRGMVVAYSTRSGHYAQDGGEGLSPYAQALIKALREPSIELDRVFRRVNAEVFQATNGIQDPSVLGTWPAQELHLAVR
jgi:DNA-binding winged helix-turn-helix (wHTH) protein